jgi:DNA repair protein RadC
MRDRLLAGPAALADYEILEMLLFLGIPRRDTKPQAKGLINRFGSLAATLTAGHRTLRAAGLEQRAIEAFDLVTEAAAQLSRAENGERVMLGSWTALERYLNLPARMMQPPAFSALLLNNRNQLLAEHRWPPSVDAATLGREMLRHALERHATAVILLRNGAAALPELTPEDRALHAQLQRAGAALLVVVHDLVVIGGGDWISLRQQRSLH